VAPGPGGSYGILLDDTRRTWFDFGKQDPQTLAVNSAAGPIDYYLIYGPSVHRVVESETPQGPLSLDVYPGEDCRGTIYAVVRDGVLSVTLDDPTGKSRLSL
jgi:hypothetical protein